MKSYKDPLHLALSKLKPPGQLRTWVFLLKQHKAEIISFKTINTYF